MNRSKPIPTYQGRSLFEEENNKRNGRVPNDSIRVDLTQGRVIISQNVARYIHLLREPKCATVDTPWEFMMVIGEREGRRLRFSNGSAMVYSENLCRIITELVGEKSQAYDLKVAVKEYYGEIWLSIERREHE